MNRSPLVIGLVVVSLLLLAGLVFTQLELQQQLRLAEAARDEAEQQRQLAGDASAEAEQQRRLAEATIERLQEELARCQEGE